MARKDPRKVPIPEFLGKYEERMREARVAEFLEHSSLLSALAELVGPHPRPPLKVPDEDWDRFASWWPMRVLRQAAEEGDSEGCKRLLHLFMLEMDIRLPKRVLMPFRWKSGRRDETEAIYKAWVDRGRPLLTDQVCMELARQPYPEEFKKARSNPSLRKRLRDRIRATIRRHLTRKSLVPGSAIQASRL